MNMRTQAATIRMTGAVEKSTQVMQSMSRLVKLPELQKTMTAMSKEMMKMGIIDELMDDAMESLDPDDMEEEVDAQVNIRMADFSRLLIKFSGRKSAPRIDQGRTRLPPRSRNIRPSSIRRTARPSRVRRRRRHAGEIERAEELKNDGHSMTFISFKSHSTTVLNLKNVSAITCITTISAHIHQFK